MLPSLYSSGKEICHNQMATLVPLYPCSAFLPPGKPGMECPEGKWGSPEQKQQADARSGQDSTLRGQSRPPPLGLPQSPSQRPAPTSRPVSFHPSPNVLQQGPQYWMFLRIFLGDLGYSHQKALSPSLPLSGSFSVSKVPSSLTTITMPSHPCNNIQSLSVELHT